MATSGLNPEVLKKLRECVSGAQQAGSSESWNSAWLKGITPWVASEAQPPLRDLLQSREIEFPTTGKALVPGCGQGHDLIVIGSVLGLQVLGVDFALAGIECAKKLLVGYLGDTVPESLKSQTIQLQQADFFELQGSYDLVYDYTFFQALQPAMRSKWGAQMQHLVKPGGYIIILAYPTNALLDQGPPFGIEQNTHAHFLGEGLWEKLLDRIPEGSSTTHVGKERLMVFKRLADQ